MNNSSRLPSLIVGIAQAWITTFVVLYFANNQTIANFLADILPKVAVDYDLINPGTGSAMSADELLRYVLRIMRTPSFCILIVTAVGELAGISSWNYWGIGMAAAYIGVPYLSGWDLHLYRELPLGYIGLALAGLVAGTVYWSFAGRSINS